jgi:hypothetical protein
LQQHRKRTVAAPEKIEKSPAQKTKRSKRVAVAGAVKRVCNSKNEKRESEQRSSITTNVPEFLGLRDKLG